MPGPEPDNACRACGRTIARDRTLCNACSGTAVPIGDQKRAEWARAAAERDAAWKLSPVESPPQPPPRNDNTCAECKRPIAPDKSLCNACGDHKREGWARGAAERDAAWKQTAPPAPPESSGDRTRADWARRAAKRDAAWRAGIPQRAARRRIAILVVVAVVLVLTIAVLVALVRGGEDPRVIPSTPVATSPVIAPAPPELPAVRIAKAATFEQAIAIARPSLADTTDELGEGAALLAIYASAKLRWSDVAVPAETTLGHVAKDPERERGKRLCAAGEILRIERRDLGGRKIHVGQLRTPEADEIMFVAVGTTGDLVKRSTGTLCGAVLGRSGSSVSILGMFDLDENRLPLVEQ